MTLADPWTTLRSIQDEYFALLAESALLARCRELDETHLAIPASYAMDGGVLMRTQSGWRPAAAREAETLLENVRDFWARRTEDLTSALRIAPGRHIHVESREPRRTLSRYGPFFDSILVSDQLLQTAYEYFNNDDRSGSWQGLVETVVRAGMQVLLDRDLFVPLNGRPLAIIVPSTLFIKTHLDEVVMNSAIDLTTEFVGELLGQSFPSMPHFAHYYQRKRPAESSLNQELLRALLARSNAPDLRAYDAYLRTGSIDRGTHWTRREPLAAVLAYDVTARFREFEKVSIDALSWQQEPEIPGPDIKLYEWWFDRTSRATAAALGSHYSEDFTAKLAARAPALDFLESVSIADLTTFLQSDPVLELRDDLALVRAEIRRGQGTLSDDIAALDQHITSRLTSFSEKLEKAETNISSETRRSTGKLALTALLTVASTALAPLSALSLVWGGTLDELRQRRAAARAEAGALLARPMATLLQWKSRRPL